MHHITTEMSIEFLRVLVFTIINQQAELLKQNSADSKKFTSVN